ncbi:hypothetical protein Hesp01_47720 [Herbidospora sp. NBRC 101105]|nr:hypothetical protein Hesp01_47720 [Herbidospora sp. NBRC 101105]
MDPLRAAEALRTEPAEADREADAFRAEPADREADALPAEPDALRAEPADVAADARRAEPADVEADDLRAEPADVEADDRRAEPADVLAEPAVREVDARRTEPVADAPERDDDARRADAEPDAVRDDAAAPLRPALDRDAAVRAVVAFRAVPERAADVRRAGDPEAAALAVRLAADVFAPVVFVALDAALPVMAEMVRSALAAIPDTRADTPRDVRAEAAFARVDVRERDPLARSAGFRRPCSSRTCDRSRSTSSLRARSNAPSTWSAPDRTYSWIPFDDRDDRDDDRDEPRRDFADRDESVSSRSMTAARALLVAVSVSDVAICTMPRSVWNTMRTPLSPDTPPRVRFRVVLRLNATVRW